MTLVERLLDCDHNWHEAACHEAAARITALEAREAELVGALGKLQRVLLPVEMTLAQQECIDEPVPDSAVILSFMGSGASDSVTAGEYREAINTARALIERQTDG